jgi:photosynthetic reaction center cytochrome c subunit
VKRGTKGDDMSYPILRWAATGLATVAAVLLAGCEKPPMDSTQTAFRGLAMGAVTNPRITAPVNAAQVLPAAIPAMASPPGTPTAGASFKNVKVLADVPVTEFTRTMLAITAWVSPKEGCAYCHKEGEDLAADTLYTKVVARKMLEMNRTINAKWDKHTLQTGVTCYTCHRGQAVPPSVWFDQQPPKTALGNTAQSAGHNRPSPETGLTAIDNNVLVRYLLGNEPLRNAGVQALPVKGTMGQTIVNTENTFGFMIHISKALGVNCTHCHNTRSHADWSESPPTRAQAYHGILMARELNNSFMVPLTATFPAKRLGAKGDVAKISCATCHQGVNKPLKGAPMLKDFPALGTVKAPADAGSHHQRGAGAAGRPAGQGAVRQRQGHAGPGGHEGRGRRRRRLAWRRQRGQAGGVGLRRQGRQRRRQPGTGQEAGLRGARRAQARRRARRQGRAEEARVCGGRRQCRRPTRGDRRGQVTLNIVHRKGAPSAPLLHGMRWPGGRGGHQVSSYTQAGAPMAMQAVSVTRVPGCTSSWNRRSNVAPK